MWSDFQVNLNDNIIIKKDMLESRKSWKTRLLKYDRPTDQVSKEGDLHKNISSLSLVVAKKNKYFQ